MHVLTNMRRIFHDENIWQNPTEFKADRFINEKDYSNNTLLPAKDKRMEVLNISRKTALLKHIDTDEEDDKKKDKHQMNKLMPEGLYFLSRDILVMLLTTYHVECYDETFVHTSVFPVDTRPYKTELLKFIKLSESF